MSFAGNARKFLREKRKSFPQGSRGIPAAQLNGRLPGQSLRQPDDEPEKFAGDWVRSEAHDDAIEQGVEDDVGAGDCGE
jgi:hypothetical protein